MLVQGPTVPQHLRRLLVTQISGPRFSRIQSDGPWKGPGKLVLNMDMNHMDGALSLATARWALRRPPEEQGTRTEGSVCI